MTARLDAATTAGGNESASETDISPADRDSTGRTKHQPISRAIKGLFRGAVKALTRRGDDEPPPPRRRGETGRAFGVVAKAALYRAVRIPEEAYAAATDFLIGTLDCMNPWPSDDADNFDNLDGDCDNTDKNYPSLHL